MALFGNVAQWFGISRLPFHNICGTLARSTDGAETAVRKFLLLSFPTTWIQRKCFINVQGPIEFPGSHSNLPPCAYRQVASGTRTSGKLNRILPPLAQCHKSERFAPSWSIIFAVKISGFEMWNFLSAPLWPSFLCFLLQDVVSFGWSH